jgi:hypothetical protein
LSINHCRHDCYCDDTQLYISGKPKDIDIIIEKLNEDLINVVNYMNHNFLQVNPNKTQLIVFGVPNVLKKLKVPNVLVDGEIISRSTVVKNLGVYIDEKLSFSDHVNKTISSIYRASFALRNAVDCLKASKVIELAKSLVFPIADYCCVVWGNCTQKLKQDLQKALNFTVKLVFGRKKYDHVSDLFKKYKLMNIEDRIHLFLSSQTYKCLNGLAPAYLNDEFYYRWSDRGNFSRVEVKPWKRAEGAKTFTHRAANLWNQLDQASKEAANIKKFTRKIKNKIKNSN